MHFLHTKHATNLIAETTATMFHTNSCDGQLMKVVPSL